MADVAQLDALHARLSARLIALRGAAGEWRGHLSSSALANALACMALYDSPTHSNREPVERGLRWLCEVRNADGGWGDTPDSPSNLSTTLLCRCALRRCGTPDEPGQNRAARAAAAWTRKRCGQAEGIGLAQAVRGVYGRDRTFAAPILAVCAQAGLLGDAGWQAVPSLPFRLALLPRRSYGLLRLGVVSYALPALIAVGLMIWQGRRGAERERASPPALFAPVLLRRLAGLQPASGGFLEAIPLTAFVVIGLTKAGYGDDRVARRGCEFLLARLRADGGWPVDSDLATWCTSEAVKGLGAGGMDGGCEATREWFLGQQFAEPHPYTGAPPGGWGWTDRPGAVPDGDDSSGVLLALDELDPSDPPVQAAAERGVGWLLHLQNRDGGVPTFCRGWGRLPFDRSCPDITAHALAAVGTWIDRLPTLQQDQAQRFRIRAGRYLQRSQAADGSWTALWFGNQAMPEQRNRVFGTARVLAALGIPALRPDMRTPQWRRTADAAVGFLRTRQHGDGGWGGAAASSASIEETAVALTGLLRWAPGEASERGLRWLARAWVALPDGVDTADRSGGPALSDLLAPAPIGLYFQSLWYSEALYPLVFSLQALRLSGPGTASGAKDRCPVQNRRCAEEMR